MTSVKYMPTGRDRWPAAGLGTRRGDEATTKIENQIPEKNEKSMVC